MPVGAVAFAVTLIVISLSAIVAVVKGLFNIGEEVSRSKDEDNQE